MQFARDLFIKTFSRNAREDGDRAGVPILMGPGGGKGGRPNLVKMWFMLAVGVVVASIVLVFLSQVIFGNAKVGVFVATVLLAVLGGWFLTFIAPAKVVSAVWGALVGSGAEHATTGGGFIGQAQEIVGKATSTLGTILPPLIEIDQDYMSAMVWVFLAVIFLLCLPAFFKN
jgi:hypothetical protein